MARIRSIKPAFFLNEDVASLSFEWRLLFIGIWTQADRAGRLEDRPLRLKATLFPYDGVDVEVGLKRLAEAGLIVRYVVGDQRVIAVPTFAKHQQPHVREAETELPPPPEHVPSTVLAPGQPTRSGSGKGADPDPEESSAPRAASEPAELVFPTVGAGGTRWPLTATQVTEWRGLYPTLDVLAEARKALAWVKAKPGRRKTTRGMAAFLVGWLNRAQDNGHARSAAPASESRRIAGSVRQSTPDKYAGITRGLDADDD